MDVHYGKLYSAVNPLVWLRGTVPYSKKTHYNEVYYSLEQLSNMFSGVGAPTIRVALAETLDSIV